MKTSIDILKTWFQTGDKPTETQFENLIDSFHHKDDGNLIKDYEIFDNGNVSFTFSDGNTAKIEKFVLPNTMPQNFIQGLVETLNSKVNFETGKQLSDENFTTALQQKLLELKNYVHPEFHQITEIKGLQEAIESKVDIVAGKQLSDENFSTEEKEKLAGLENYTAPDSKPISYIEELEDTLAKINQDLETKVEIVEGKQLSDENFTIVEKEKLASFNINTFASISDGTNTIEANGQADQIVFDGVTIDPDLKVIKVEGGTLPENIPMSKIEDLQQEIESIYMSIDEKASQEDIQIELNAINEDLNNKIDEGGLEPYIQNLEEQINDKVDSTEFYDELDQIKSDIDNKLDESQVDDKIADVKSELDSINEDLNNKIDEAALEPYIQNLEEQINDKISGIEFHDELDQIKLDIDNKLDESQVDDKIADVKSELDNKVDKVPGKQLSTNDFTTAEKQKLADLGNQSLKIYKDSKSVFHDPEDLKAGKIDLLDQSFIAYELLRGFNTIKINCSIRCYIPNNVQVTQDKFNFSVELGLIRNLNFAYPLFNVSVINFDQTKLSYINDITLITDLVTHNANGVKFITQNIEIDCSKPIQTSYSKTETYPRDYFDYPLSETPNKTDKNKLLLNFTSSPFRIWAQASAVMVY
ncbi:hypothetical protein [Tenacibaculum jejuense]|uniref:Uncharacterized protein n=1 Tax=Tenacibaculum jejuense TaxID=584609 RepID=A0A238UBF8_9FLAO|nr:hypothetical protein [Tenacibaculum jejuense]SNR16543.1 protein of unknown function [Tenacibaculum jejuense]